MSTSSLSCSASGSTLTTCVPSFSASTAVNHRPPVIQTFLFGHLGGHQQEVPQQGAIGGLRFFEAGDVLAWNYQQVNWGLRLNIGKGNAVLVFMDPLGWDLAAQDASEDGGVVLSHRACS